jgi:hypothetical protein
MTVRELISRLKDEDPGLRVVVQGYEQGYDEIREIALVQVAPNPAKNIPWWDGELLVSHSEGAETVLSLPRGKNQLAI